MSEVKLIFHPDAEKEFNEAVIWYKKQRKGLELEFIFCIDEALQRIKRNYKIYPIIFDQYKKVIVRRFPFIIIFRTLKNSIRILAIFHSKKRIEKIYKRKFN